VPEVDIASTRSGRVASVATQPSANAVKRYFDPLSRRAMDRSNNP
jgi:hypothetical protein